MSAAVRVRRPERTGRRVQASIEIAGNPRMLWYETSAEVTAEAESFVAAGLLPAMRLGRPLCTDSRISPMLLAALPTIQSVFNQWVKGFRIVPVEAAARDAPAGPRPSGVACFFSGGVDSFYTALMHREELTALIYVHGFDIALRDRRRREQVARGIREAAAELGIRLIEVETNVRSFLAPFAGWGWAHGPAGASIGYLLSAVAGRLLVPASNSYRDDVPRGSHPTLDPLWTTERVELVYEGLSATRADKIRYLGRNETAMRWLRVCHAREAARGYNCGRCEKCLRTMVGLRAAGALEACATFSSSPDLRAIGALRLSDSNRDYWIQNLEDAGSRDPELAAAIRGALSRRPPGIAAKVARRIRRRVRRRRGSHRARRT